MSPPHRDSESAQIDTMISSFRAALEGKPHYARNLLRLAEMVRKKVRTKRDKLRAFELASEALKLASGDADTEIEVRYFLASLLPAYHAEMMNDARRNEAWDRALRRAIRPGMRVFEIGTGAGMLALMAARAGAEKVITCETDPVAAAVAREICDRNGYADRIDVICKPANELLPGVDLERPADLLFCDIFSLALVGFDPFPALADARARLLQPGAPVIPASGIIKVALARWTECDTFCRASRAGGFDIGPFSKLAPISAGIRTHDPSLTLCSPGAEAFRFDFAAPQPGTGRAQLTLQADRDGTVDGIAQWIRLELDSEAALEVPPGSGESFFEGTTFWPLTRSVQLRRGETVEVIVRYRNEKLFIHARFER
jgi:SAM-dependent methyltransferase